MPIEAVVFDAYGTLFDVASVQSVVATVAPNSAEFTALWRAKQLEYSFLRAPMDRYVDFGQITFDALTYTLDRFGMAISTRQLNSLMRAWSHVAPFADAAPALQSLESYRRAILSNGTPAMLTIALTSARLVPYFDAVLSADEVRTFKPRPEVYALVERHLGISPDRTAFVSSNGWDVAGAAAFGFRVCWINRMELPVEQLGVQPAVTIRLLADLPNALPRL